MVDIFLEYGYYIVGVGASAVAMISVYFSVKKYMRDLKIEQDKSLDTKINAGVQQVIKHFDDKTEVINQKFITTDTVLTQNQGDIESIQEDIKILEKDFKSLCQTIGKHEYVVDKVFPEYINLRNSIHDFKEKVNENILSNSDHVSRNTEHDTGQEGFK